MKLHTEIVNATSERIAKKGAQLPSKPAKPLAIESVLPPDRIARVTKYINENRVPDDDVALERAFGNNDLLSLYYFWAGLRAARSVGRIQIARGPGDPGGYATGFLIAPNLLLTNWHVFQTDEVANRSRVQFAYESDSEGHERTATWFSFAPDKFFISRKGLDYCVVAVNPESQQGPDTLNSFGWLRLNPQLGKADYGQYLSIVQHPGGESKKVAIRENKLLPFDDAEDYLTYQSDTFRGSSGSPVFNDLWDVVALHHSGKPLKDANGHFVGHDGQPIVDHVPEENEIQWIANEGIRASRVVADFLASAANGEFKEQAKAAFDGTIQTEQKPLESKLVEKLTATNETPTAATPRAADGNVLMVLPLNVSVTVRSADAAALKSPEKPTLLVASAPQTLPDEVILEKLNFDDDYSGREGYSDSFLGRDRIAPMPTINRDDVDQIAPTKKRGKILHYHHYSVMVHAKRRIPVLAACNADYSKGQRKVSGRDTFGKDEWITDIRMDEKYQLPRGFYDRWKRLDYGHLVRRDDNCWGASKTEIEFANADTFHLTNCTPQHEAFNRDMFQYHGLWGRLENVISSQAKKDNALAKLCIFSGPIFTNRDLKLEDEEEGNVYVPFSFWKVVIAPTDRGGIHAYGFIVSQKESLDDDPPFVELEEFKPGRLHDYQSSLDNIEKRTVVRFDESLKAVDVMKGHPSGEELMPVMNTEELFLGQR